MSGSALWWSRPDAWIIPAVAVVALSLVAMVLTLSALRQGAAGGVWVGVPTRSARGTTR